MFALLNMCFAHFCKASIFLNTTLWSILVIFKYNRTQKTRLVSAKTRTRENNLSDWQMNWKIPKNIWRHTINTSCVILSSSYKKFVDDNGCCREKEYLHYHQIVKKAAYRQCIHPLTIMICLSKTAGAYIPYTLSRLVRGGCFSFEKCIRNVFIWQRVVFQDGEERTVPSVSGVWSFKSQHQCIKATKKTQTSCQDDYKNKTGPC